jgi:D-sedoheptulose 7-phosphate isomerase
VPLKTSVPADIELRLEPIDTVRAIFDEATLAHQRFASQGLPGVVAAAAAISQAVGAGRKVLAFGNGGSAADAGHLVAELVGRFEDERRPLGGIALTADSSVVTAISNDYGYVHVFTRQIEALGSVGDIAFGISTSGRSKNVEAALAAARARGMVTIALTGRDGGRMGVDADIHLNVPEPSTPRIQEVHRTILHAMCSLIERSLEGNSQTP